MNVYIGHSVNAIMSEAETCIVHVGSTAARTALTASLPYPPPNFEGGVLHALQRQRTSYDACQLFVCVCIGCSQG